VLTSSFQLLISMHSFNALNGGDVYSKKFTESGFYSSADAAKAFDARLSHILSHEHSTLKKPWKELKEYIFAFEAENEAMIGLVSAACCPLLFSSANTAIGRLFHHRAHELVGLTPGCLRRTCRLIFSPGSATGQRTSSPSSATRAAYVFRVHILCDVLSVRADHRHHRRRVVGG
jgi:hypothetical protein